MWKELLPKIVGMKPIYSVNYVIPYAVRVKIIISDLSGYDIGIGIRLEDEIFTHKKGMEFYLRFIRGGCAVSVEKGVFVISYNILHGKGESLRFDELSGWSQ